MVQPSALSMEVELVIACRKLKDLDVFSKSDPVVRVTTYSDSTRAWIKVGQTERINNNLNPDFKTTVRIGYSFEKH